MALQSTYWKVNILLNKNIITNYFVVLNKHIIDINTFHNKTEQLSTSDEIHNLHAEDLAFQAAKQCILEEEITRADKILIILNEITVDSKAYQNKLSELIPIFGSIVSTINFVNKKHFTRNAIIDIVVKNNIYER